jgi:hypothetical protein
MDSRVVSSQPVYGKTTLELLLEIRGTFSACIWMRKIGDGGHRPGTRDESTRFGKEGGS